MYGRIHRCLTAFADIISPLIHHPSIPYHHTPHRSWNPTHSQSRYQSQPHLPTAHHHIISIILLQCIGAVIGAGILHGCTPTSVSASLGANGLGPNNVTGVGLVTVAPGAGRRSPLLQNIISLMSGFVLEALLTMLLVLVVYATAVDNKVIL